MSSRRFIINIPSLIRCLQQHVCFCESFPTVGRLSWCFLVHYHVIVWSYVTVLVFYYFRIVFGRHVCRTTWFNKCIGDTTWKPPLVEAQTALGKQKIRRRTIFNTAVEIFRSFACYSETISQISSQFGHQRRSNDVIYNFKMAAAAAQFFLPVSDRLTSLFFGCQFQSAAEI